MATKLPDVLNSHREEINAALAMFIPTAWENDDEEATYIDAEQPERIARALIAALYPHLVNAQIGFLYRKEIKRHRSVVLGQASKVGGKLAHFTHLDFLIEINWKEWKQLDPARKVALIDHELMHCGYDSDRDRFVMEPHDLEEFNAIARRWGVWRSQLARFANALGEGAQTSLFPHD